MELIHYKDIFVRMSTCLVLCLCLENKENVRLSMEGVTENKRAEKKGNRVLKSCVSEDGKEKMMDGGIGINAE